MVLIRFTSVPTTDNLSDHFHISNNAEYFSPLITLFSATTYNFMLPIILHVWRIYSILSHKMEICTLKIFEMTILKIEIEAKNIRVALNCRREEKK